MSAKKSAKPKTVRTPTRGSRTIKGAAKDRLKTSPRGSKNGTAKVSKGLREKNPKKTPQKDPQKGSKQSPKKDPRRSWTLRLYIAGDSPRSRTALQNLERMCEKHLPGRYQIEVVDLVKQPELAKAHQILAIPTLVRELPEPIKRVIGDLSDESRALLNLDVEVLEGTQSTVRD